MKPLLEPGAYYHIYNHANGSDNLFRNDDNYMFFLKKYSEFISPVADTFAYCLMPNHFHLAVRMKDFQSRSNLQGFQNLGGFFVGRDGSEARLYGMDKRHRTLRLPPPNVGRGIARCETLNGNPFCLSQGAKSRTEHGAGRRTLRNLRRFAGLPVACCDGLCSYFFILNFAISNKKYKLFALINSLKINLYGITKISWFGLIAPQKP
jgi:hypothetical protein